MKIKINLVLSVLCAFFCATISYASEPSINVDIDFDSSPLKHLCNHHVLSFNKVIKLNPYRQKSNIIHSQSTLHGRFPETIALMVKPVHFHDDKIKLQFNLVHYGFSKAGSILSQPVLALAKGQMGELKTNQFRLKVIADW